MCNLYKHTSNVDALKAVVATLNRPNYLPTGYISPLKEAPIIRNASGGHEIAVMKWGVPLLAKEGAKPKPVTNVRNMASPFWRSMLASPERRCLVPANAFSEWTDTPDPMTGKRVMRWFAMKEADLFCFAGVWRPTEEGERFAFLTTDPNNIVAPVHAKAMPVILEPRDYERWLTTDYEGACALQKPYPSNLMTVVDDR